MSMPRHTRSPLFIRAKLWWLVVVRICAQVLSGFVKRKESGGEEKKRKRTYIYLQGAGKRNQPRLASSLELFPRYPRSTLFCWDIYPHPKGEICTLRVWIQDKKIYSEKKRGKKIVCRIVVIVDALPLPSPPLFLSLSLLTHLPLRTWLSIVLYIPHSLSIVVCVCSHTLAIVYII